MHIKIIAILFISFFLSSCKRCITCKNTCYYCTGFNKTYCNNNFPNNQGFNDFLGTARQSGFVCTQETSTFNEQICDKPSEIDNWETLYKSQKYTCTQ